MDSHEIRMMRSLGGAERFVAPTLGFDGSLDWSPSGDLLVATGKESQEEPDAIFLYSVDSKSGRPKRLTTPPPGPADSGDVHGRFSPDGSRIAFLRDLEDARTDIFVQALSGNDEARRVTHVDADTRFGSFDWLPDASGFLACIGDRLFHVSLASGELSPLELRGMSGARGTVS